MEPFDGIVHDLCKPYVDGRPAYEIHVRAGNAHGLPFVYGQRVPIALRIAGTEYRAGLRSLEHYHVVWVCPDMRSAAGSPAKLGRILTDAGFQPGQRVRLSLQGTTLTVTPA
jgi:hypothetical protein